MKYTEQSAAMDTRAQTIRSVKLNIEIKGVDASFKFTPLSEKTFCHLLLLPILCRKKNKVTSHG